MTLNFILSSYRFNNTKFTKAYLILIFISFKLLQPVIANECNIDTLFSNRGLKREVLFEVDKDTNFYVYKINKISKGAHCLGIVEDKLYMFDGQYNYTLSTETLEVLERKKILNSQQRIITSGTSFYNGKYLVMKDLRGKKVKDLADKFIYIYDLENKTLSRKIKDKDNFIPITNCKECDPILLDSIFYNNSMEYENASGSYSYQDQNRKYIIYSTIKMIKNKEKRDVTFEVRYYIIDKRSAQVEELTCMRDIPHGLCTNPLKIVNNKTIALETLVQTEYNESFVGILIISW